jgi:integrase
MACLNSNPGEWTPRELRHSFVSLLSNAGLPLEEIARLVGRAGTSVTEAVYRHELRPVLQTGASTMDRRSSVEVRFRCHTDCHTWGASVGR